MDKDKTPPNTPFSAGDQHAPDSPAPEADHPPKSNSSADEKSAAGTAAKPASPPSATPSPGAKRRSGFLKAMVWLLVVAVLVAAGYYLWPHYGEQFRATYFPGDSNARQPTVSIPAAAPAQELLPDSRETPSVAAITEALAAESQAREILEEELRGEIADLHLQLNSYSDRLRSLSTTSREDWLLAEAEYLLRLASQRILTERQSANALALMESADTILRDFNDTELFPVRRALANDITSVRMVAVIDREGIYLRLGALVDAVDQLGSLLPEPSTPTLVEVEDAVAPGPWYQQLLDNARQALTGMAGLVRIERRDVALQPLLTLEQEQILRHNLKVVLEQARLALLREEQGIYDASLDRAAHWVQANFENDSVAAVFLEDIAMLKQQSIVQTLPSLTGSIRALQEYIRLWHNRYGEAASAPVERIDSADESGEDNP